MSGEHIWVASRMIFTTGKWGIWPLVVPKNHGFVKLWIFQGGKERPKHKMNINTTYGGGGTLLSMLGKINYLLLWALLVWGKGNYYIWMVTIAKEDHSVFPYGLMVELGDEHRKWT